MDLIDGAGMGKLHNEHYIAVSRQGKKPVDFSIEHTALDRLHHAMETLVGIPVWGEARDVMAAILKKNGSTPSFHVAMDSALRVITPILVFLPVPILLCVLNSAWIWVTFSNRKIIHDE